jgi:hypothetical protein
MRRGGGSRRGGLSRGGVGDRRASAPFDRRRRARSALSAQLGSRVLGMAVSYDLLFRITYVSASRKFKNRFRWVTFVCNLSIDMKNCMKVTKTEDIAAKLFLAIISSFFKIAGRSRRHRDQPIPCRRDRRGIGGAVRGARVSRAGSPCFTLQPRHQAGRSRRVWHLP